jgi:Predicted HD superfamily hydrolase
MVTGPSTTIAALLASDLVKRIRVIGHSFCVTEGGSHGPDHSERVLHTALRIGERLGARLDILAPAALLHDIARKEENLSRGLICHARHGAEKLAPPLLRDLGYDDEAIKAICHCIHTHRFRSSVRPATLEAEILYDADKLDSIGAVGIGRAFLFAGQVGARLHNPELDPATTSPYSLEDTAYREFRIKMAQVRTHMLTTAGREMAEQRHAFMQTFFDQLTRETHGILP